MRSGACKEAPAVSRSTDHRFQCAGGSQTGGQNRRCYSTQQTGTAECGLISFVVDIPHYWGDMGLNAEQLLAIVERRLPESDPLPLQTLCPSSHLVHCCLAFLKYVLSKQKYVLSEAPSGLCVAKYRCRSVIFLAVLSPNWVICMDIGETMSRLQCNRCTC